MNTTNEVMVPQVEPTDLRSSVDYSYYYVLMGKLITRIHTLPYTSIQLLNLIYFLLNYHLHFSANSLGLVFVPIIVLIILNTMIFRTINQATQRHNAISSHQRRDHSVAMMLILIGTEFILKI